MPSLAGAALVDGLAADARGASFLQLDAAPPPWPGRPVGGRLISGGALEELGVGRAAAADLAGARRSASAAFLAPAEGRGAASTTSFLLGKSSQFELLKTPKLGKLRLYLMYQTPEIYKTDIGEQKFPYKRGWKYACVAPDSSGLGKPVPLHPSIVFNSMVKNIHVHMEDTSTGDVYWDADYVVPRNLKWAAMGKSELPSSAPALNGAAGVFRQPCVPRDDGTTHQFEMSIQTQDGTYDDNTTPWAENEGFANFGGPKAHIGFDAKRLPLLEPEGGGELGKMNSILGGALTGTQVDPAAPQNEVVGHWTRGGSYSRGPTHHNRHDRILAGEEDPFYDNATGRSYRGYYYHIIQPAGRQRNMYEYLDKNTPPATGSILGQRALAPSKGRFVGGVMPF